jgi:hypothetical protein
MVLLLGNAMNLKSLGIEGTALNANKIFACKETRGDSTVVFRYQQLPSHDIACMYVMQSPLPSQGCLVTGRHI